MTILRRHGPVNIVMYHPTSEAGKEALARRISDVHANVVIRRLKDLNCPSGQKTQLLDAVIELVLNETP